ncbi:MAG: hypothetical protein WA786_03200 [Acidimicrobiales bacterium]
MSFHPIRRGLTILALASFGAPLIVVPAGVAYAASTKAALPAKTIVRNSDLDINAIRTYFFCQTAKCKKAVTLNKAAAQAGLADIRLEIGKMKTDAVPASEATIVAKYVTDATALVNALTNYPKATTGGGISNDIGIIYYQTSNLGSDDYLIECIATKAPVSFKTWSVGVVGVAYAMQVDTRAETPSSTRATIASINESLLAEAASMKSDANGPNAAFNKLIVQFAATQTLDSRDSLLVVANQPGSITAADLKALAAKLTLEFKNLAALHNKLDG